MIRISLEKKGLEESGRLSLRTFKKLGTPMNENVVRILESAIRRRRLDRVCAARGHRVQAEGICGRCMLVVDEAKWDVFREA